MANLFWRNRAISVALSLAAASSVIGGVGIPTVEAQRSNFSFSSRAQSAFATTSGGRARGGDFGDDEPAEERSSQPKPSRDYSESSYNRSRSNNNYNGNSENYRNNGNNNGNGTASDALMFFMFLIFVVYLIKSGTLNTFLESAKTTATESGVLALSAETPQAPVQSSRTASRRLSTEITNDTVTVTQVQVAMLAEARHVQQTLNKIAKETDMSDRKGLTKSLRETVLTLLRSPETWTHSSAQSKTIKSKMAAKEVFEALSLEERSKFDVESISNVDGKVEEQNIIQRSQGLASYIVVTLIVGTAHDNPLLTQAMSTDELRAALKKLGSVDSDYLMVYEVLWSPQDEDDSLTDDELLLNYPDMFRIC